MFSKIMQTIKKEKTQSSQNEIQDVNEIPKVKQIEKEIPIFKVNHKILEQYEIKCDGIDGVYYLPDHLNDKQQEYLIEQIYEQQDKWNELQYSKRRVQKYGGDVTDSGLQDQSDLPYFLKSLSKLCYLDQQELNLNHVLINEYQKGIGIYPHSDGPLYHKFVNIFSLNSYCIFKFTQQDKIKKLLLEPKSLLIFSKSAYLDWLHGIEFVVEDIGLIYEDDNKQIIRSDLVNFQQTQIGMQWDLNKELINQNYEITNIHNNNLYNKAIIFRRSTRISITIRHVPNK